VAELRADARAAHAQAIAGQADFAQVLRIWADIQLAFIFLYFAWFFPRRNGFGLALAQRAASVLNTQLWKVVPIRSFS
jgi:hypothetical protein